MILVGESDPNARELPFRLPDETDPRVGVLAHGFVLGEVKVRTPGAPYVNVLVADIAEIGYGDYVARLTGPQATVEGFTYLYANVAGAQLWTSVEQVGLQPSGTVEWGINVTYGTVPVLSGCTPCTIHADSTNQAGRVTCTDGPNACTITFSDGGYPTNGPACIALGTTSTTTVYQTASPTTTAATFTTQRAGVHAFDYICKGFK